MAKRFSGKVSIVTGAGSGIGLATAGRLAAEGAVVVAAVFDRNQLSSVGRFDGQLLDVRSEADWDRVLAQTETAHGGLDILVNNAGVHRVASAEDTTRELWDFISETNLYGTFLGCRKAIPLLRRRGGGVIVNLASFAAIRGVPRQVAYATSKGGILAMTLALAVDHVHENIRVNCVCPGATGTPIIDALVATSDNPDRFRAELAARSPMGAMATPEEVAATIAFLVSDDASHITGIALPVDGGRSGR
ncbi:SDR family oxidoreductase [Rhizobiales bacterium]|uniref:SDR family NAD(P)-dependent oxidoreductase n=1 Tax=Hongsoonwoonella zoysiae TaxID=2821844 RepID=UPI00156049B3|nr:SDR family NAD(P)-dependent oxidoreductase [Hongsoonwoonella zoysiae]NRG18430.1 SDR family oxidoreductase [Hongsoonwoonella zoysiae]